MTGKFIDPITLSDYSVQHNFRVNGGTTGDLYAAFAMDQGAKYRFRFVEDVKTTGDAYWNTLSSKLSSGKVAIIHTGRKSDSSYGHIVALVDYDSSTNRFLLLDSSPSSSRSTNATGYTWATITELKGKNGNNEYNTAHILESTTKTINASNSLITAKDIAIPEKIIQGNSFDDFSGTISSPNGLTIIGMSIYNSKNERIQNAMKLMNPITMGPANFSTRYSFNFKNIYSFDYGKIDFKVLPQGTYYIAIYAICDTRTINLISFQEYIDSDYHLNICKEKFEVSSETKAMSVKASSRASSFGRTIYNSANGNTYYLYNSQTSGGSSGNSYYDSSSSYPIGTYTVKVNSFLNCREDHTANSKSLYRLYNNDVVDVTATDGNWGYTKYGWICLDYTVYGSQISTPVYNQPNYDTGNYAVSTKAGLWVRGSAGNGSKIVAPFESGSYESGYTLSGVYTDAANTKVWNLNTDTVTQSMDLYLVWEKNTYTVTFLDKDGNVLSEQDVAYGDAADAPAWTAYDGYIFSGWSRDYSSIIDDTTVQATYISRADLTEVTLSESQLLFENDTRTAQLIATVKLGKDATNNHVIWQSSDEDIVLVDDMGNVTAVADGEATVFAVAEDSGISAMCTVTVSSECVHNYEKVITPPTCTTGGYTVYTCTKCGDSYTADATSALGHSYGEWRTEYDATCTENGLKIRHCGNCGDEQSEIIVMTGHSDTDGDGICNNCGENISLSKCSCNCHKSGFMGFIWKIINFFNKLFKINQYCECGARHW